MNVLVSVTPLEAPGLPFNRRIDYINAIKYFQGKMKTISVDPAKTLVEEDLYNKVIDDVPQNIKKTLIFLRFKRMSSMDIDLTKTFNEQKITDKGLLNLNVLIN